MDVLSMLDGQAFVWDGDKASSNASAHGVRFEQAREAFLDPFVHVIWEGDALRIISARLAEPAERKRYEDE